MGRLSFEQRSLALSSLSLLPNMRQQIEEREARGMTRRSRARKKAMAERVVQLPTEEGASHECRGSPPLQSYHTAAAGWCRCDDHGQLWYSGTGQSEIEELVGSLGQAGANWFHCVESSERGCQEALRLCSSTRRDRDFFCQCYHTKIGLFKVTEEAAVWKTVSR